MAFWALPRHRYLVSIPEGTRGYLTKSLLQRAWDRTWVHKVMWEFFVGWFLHSLTLTRLDPLVLYHLDSIVRVVLSNVAHSWLFLLVLVVPKIWRAAITRKLLTKIWTPREESDDIAVHAEQLERILENQPGVERLSCGKAWMQNNRETLVHRASGVRLPATPPEKFAEQKSCTE